MSTTAKIIGAIIIVFGFILFALTTWEYGEATKKMGLNVLTSDEGKQIFEYWIGEVIIILVGIGIFALGVKICRSSK